MLIDMVVKMLATRDVLVMLEVVMDGIVRLALFLRLC